jgi:hypothetical protein
MEKAKAMMSVDDREPEPVAVEAWQREVDYERQRRTRLRDLRAEARQRLKKFFKTAAWLVGGWVGIGLLLENWDFGPWPARGPNWITRQIFDLTENMWVWWVVGGLFVFVILSGALNEAGYHWRSPIDVRDVHDPW